VWDVILNRKHERSLSGLIATHDMEEAQILCDRVLFIEHGQLQGGMPVVAEPKQPPSTLSVRFSAPRELVDEYPLLQTLITKPMQGITPYQVQCPKDRLSELVSIVIAGENVYGFNAQIEIRQQGLESAYLDHVSAAD